MKKLLVTLFALAAMFSCSNDAKAVNLINSESTWNYKVLEQNLVSGVKNNSLTYDSTFWNNNEGWSQAGGVFGNQVYDSNEIPKVNGLWTANTSLALKQSFNLTNPLKDLTLNLAVDNGATVFINGQKVFNDYKDGYTSRNSQWEYTRLLDTSVLVQGQNTVSVFAADGGVVSAFDMQLSGNEAPVPEPSTMFLGFLGASGLLGIRRRKKN